MITKKKIEKARQVCLKAQKKLFNSGKKYPKYNGEKLDPISRARMDKIENIIFAYLRMMGAETIEGDNYNESIETVSYNLAFEILTTK